MTISDSAEYERHFTPGSLVTVGIDLADHTFCEIPATITAVRGVEIELEPAASSLCASMNIGLKAVLSTAGGWAVCRCQGSVAQDYNGGNILLHLSGSVDVQQRREHFRLDVSLPVLYEIPSDQRLSTVQQKWELNRMSAWGNKPPLMVPTREGWRIVYWQKRQTIRPTSINLSASGVRIPLPGGVEAGTLIDLQIFLPLSPPRVIMTVGAVIRSTSHDSHGEASLLQPTALRFECIDERDRETLISYLFLEQRNALRQKTDERIAAMYDEQEEDAE